MTNAAGCPPFVFCVAPRPEAWCEKVIRENLVIPGIEPCMHLGLEEKMICSCRWIKVEFRNSTVFRKYVFRNNSSYLETGCPIQKLDVEFRNDRRRIQKLFRHIRKLLCRIQYSETTLSYSEIKKTIENLNGTLKKPQAKP